MQTPFYFSYFQACTTSLGKKNVAAHPHSLTCHITSLSSNFQKWQSRVIGSFGLFFYSKDQLFKSSKLRVFSICNVPWLCVWRYNWKGAIVDYCAMLLCYIEKIEERLKYARSRTRRKWSLFYHRHSFESFKYKGNKICQHLCNMFISEILWRFVYDTADEVLNIHQKCKTRKIVSCVLLNFVV